MNTRITSLVLGNVEGTGRITGRLWPAFLARLGSEFPRASVRGRLAAGDRPSLAVRARVLSPSMPLPEDYLQNRSAVNRSRQQHTAVGPGRIR